MIKDTLSIKVHHRSKLFEDIILSTGATSARQKPSVKLTVQVDDSESKEFRLTDTNAEWSSQGVDSDFYIETEWESVNET